MDTGGPDCLRCNMAMKLSQVLPLIPGFEVRLFTCAGCDHALNIAAACQAPMVDLHTLYRVWSPSISCDGESSLELRRRR
jgi:hypothetical protein